MPDKEDSFSSWMINYDENWVGDINGLLPPNGDDTIPLTDDSKLCVDDTPTWKNVLDGLWYVVSGQI